MSLSEDVHKDSVTKPRPRRGLGGVQIGCNYASHSWRDDCETSIRDSTIQADGTWYLPLLIQDMKSIGKQKELFKTTGLDPFK